MATYNKETFKRLFQSKFNLSKWQMLLQDYPPLEAVGD